MQNKLDKEVMDSLMNRESRRVVREEEYLLNRQNEAKNPTNFYNYPDAKKHQIVSFIKSGIRILGYVLIPFDLLWASIILIISEVVGVLEECV